SDPGGYPPPAPGGYPPPTPGGYDQGSSGGFPPAAPGYGQPPGEQDPPGAPGPPGAYPPGQYPGGAPPKKKSSKGPLLAILGILLVLALAAGAFFVLKGDDKGEQVGLEPIGMVQEDDFAGNLDVVGDASGTVAAADLSAVPDPTTEEVGTPLAGRVAPGGEPRPYGAPR